MALVFMEFLEVDKMLNKNWDCEQSWEDEVYTTTKLMSEGLTSFRKYAESGGHQGRLVRLRGGLKIMIMSGWERSQKPRKRNFSLFPVHCTS